MSSNTALLKLKQFDASADADETVKPKSSKKKTSKKTVRGCVFEVCEDLDVFDTVPDFDACAKSTGAAEFMWLVHDKDTYTEEDLKALESKGLEMTAYHLGDPKNPHVHAFMRFKSPITLPKIAKAFGVPEQNVQLWKGRNSWNNALSYLTHRTAGAEEKFQYDPSEVHANFDYVQKLAFVSQAVAASSANALMKQAEKKFEDLKTLYKTGEISFAELKRRFSADPEVMDLAASEKRNLDALQDLVEGEEVRKFFEDFKQPLRLIWLYGETGCGKSLAARCMAERFAKKRFPDEPPLDNSYQVLGSSRGTFEGYTSSVHCAVLDDFRPSRSFSFDDLLRNFDPHRSAPTSLPARYHDRQLAAGIVIITSRYDPAEFSYRVQGVWTAIQEEIYSLMQKGYYIEDSSLYDYDFEDIKSLYVKSGSSARWLEKGSDDAEMRKYYDSGFRGVISGTICSCPEKSAQKKGSKLDAIKKAQLRPEILTVDGPEAIRYRYSHSVWNVCDNPSQLLRRATVYKVSQGVDDQVIFQRMRPIEHDNGYCGYEKSTDDSKISLEEVWEGKSLDFNPSNTTPYNYYNRKTFDLNYNDKTLSKEADLMLRFRKSFLYIHGAAQGRYLDSYQDPEIEVKEIYDKAAFDAVVKKAKEDGVTEFDNFLAKIKEKIDAV